MGRLAVIVPSRGRPGNVARLRETAAATCRGDTDIFWGFDEDDPDLAANRNAANDPDHTFTARGMRHRLVDWLNILAANARDDGYDYIGHIGDDNVPEAEGWDTMITESLDRQGDIGFCFGNDMDPGRAPGSLSIHIFMTANVVDRLGYFGPPSIQHMYVDPVWYAWGQRTSIEYLPDCALPHYHYSLGRSARDESYEHSTGLIPADCERYNDYCENPAGMNADIEKLDGRPFSVEEMQEFNRVLNIPRRWS
jgi:hypothetical protein